MAIVIPVVLAGSYHVKRLWRGVSGGQRSNSVPTTPKRSASRAARSADSKQYDFANQVKKTFANAAAERESTIATQPPRKYANAATQTDISPPTAQVLQANSEGEDEQLAPQDNSDIDLEEHEALDAQGEDIARSHHRLIFDGEDENDYTFGPIRVVQTFDGVSDGAALLLNMDLTGHIQDALRAAREFQEAEAGADDERMRLWDLRSEIQSKISICDYRIAVAEESNSGEVDTIRAEMENLTLFAKDVKERETMADRRLEDMARGLRIYQERVNAYLEEAFQHANLIEPPSEEPLPLEPLDLAAEYNDFCDRQQESGDSDFQRIDITANNETALERDPDELGPEDRARIEAEAQFYRAKSAFQDAQATFDRRLGDCDAEAQVSHETQSEFDLRWFQRNNQLTRELIKAEDEYHNAKAEAISVGVELRGSDIQSTHFADRSDDGYRESYENDVMASVPREKIDQWLDTIPDNPQVLQSPEVVSQEAPSDEMQLGEVPVGVSRSVINETPSDRKLIDKWREMCEQ
ncbi:hypothetical protein HII31_06173 [Pseudocercospora fuligena]|uniref:Uncharacterized protein n=1 Tax=Pseudocercospora fuligena TaxID=685502 RepID=A0A8H6VMU3_9PEZI|nr:hypothetical protein HII31_06173 [Pseudocercospora fuligena]